MREIVMSGPGKNALGTAMMTHLREQLREAAGAPVLLTGAGDAFSAGLDLKELVGLERDGMRHFLGLLEDCANELFLYPGPTVAAVNGHAIAGGCVIALACDYRVCAANERVRVGLNEIALGVRFPPRTLRVVLERVPRQHREHVLLGAQLFEPSEALRLGLIDELAQDPVAVGRERLRTLASHPPAAYRATKSDLRDEAEARITGAELAQWLDTNVPLWTSDTVKQKLAAILGR